MTAITSKNQICNMALSNLGTFSDTINDIDLGTSSKEITFRLWYDISRQNLLKMMMPNFALDRAYVAKVTGAPTFGYGARYQKPDACLKVLGIGDADTKANEISIEGGYILTNNDYGTGMPVRFVRDITDINAMSPDFIVTFAMYLASNVAMEISQDRGKAQKVSADLLRQVMASCALAGQENRPVRISRSNFRAARFGGFGYRDEKR